MVDDVSSRALMIVYLKRMNMGGYYNAVKIVSQLAKIYIDITEIGTTLFDKSVAGAVKYEQIGQKRASCRYFCRQRRSWLNRPDRLHIRVARSKNAYYSCNNRSQSATPSSA